MNAKRIRVRLLVGTQTLPFDPDVPRYFGGHRRERHGRGLVEVSRVQVEDVLNQATAAILMLQRRRAIALAERDEILDVLGESNCASLSSAQKRFRLRCDSPEG